MTTGRELLGHAWDLVVIAVLFLAYVVGLACVTGYESVTGLLRPDPASDVEVAESPRV